MRKPLVCGNWKMNKTRAEAQSFFEVFRSLVTSDLLNQVETMFAVPTTLLAELSSQLEKSKIEIAAQNVHEKPSGAFTGEISVVMLKDLKVSACVIGHSERRQYFNETDVKVAEKTQACLAADILPIVCVGETLAEREAEKTFDVIQRQVKAVITTVPNPGPVVFAYEPVWAIGTGRTATKEQAQEVHAFMRKLLTKQYGDSVANGIRILYGGSVTPANASELMQQNDVDGALVGGASLKPQDFSDVVRAAVTKAN